MNPDPQSTPLVCNMDVFTPAEREGHLQTAGRLIQSLQNIREVENGFEFSFPNETNLITSIAEFVSKERLCCPFLEFRLGVLPNDKPVTLLITGPEGTQEFLRLEFSEAFA